MAGPESQPDVQRAGPLALQADRGDGRVWQGLGGFPPWWPVQPVSFSHPQWLGQRACVRTEGMESPLSLVGLALGSRVGVQNCKVRLLRCCDYSWRRNFSMNAKNGAKVSCIF